MTEKTAYTRSIMVTGRQPHSLAFKVRLVPKGKTLFSMDEMRFDHNGVSPWQRFERQFKVMDCNEFLPVEIKIRLDYRYSIKSVLLIMGGVTVYEEDRP